MTIALSMVLGLLLISCDRAAGPNGPSPPPPPPPAPQRSTGPIAFVSDRDGTMRIYLANEDGSVVTPLVAGWHPAWARDGRRLAFTTGSGIHVIGVDGTGDRVITDSGFQPSWSPDGQSLVFVSWRDGLRLELVNPDGSNRRPLLDPGAGLLDPTWSPDGQRVLFFIGDGYLDWCFGLWTVNADGSDARQLGGRAVGRPFDSGNDCFSGEGVSLSDASQPAWSPDGSEIAFRGDRGLDIEVARADGSRRRLLVAGPAHDPDWTPDGRLIYTKGPPFDGPTRIFINDGGTDRQLIPEATAPARASYRDWSAVWLR
jgi:Tol biopolymer transport system component